MPSGVSLGSAYFTIDASAAGLIKTLYDMEQASKKSVAAISQTLSIPEKDVQRLAQTWARAEKQRADASAAATVKIMRAYNDTADAADKAAARAQKAGIGFRELALAGVGVGSGLAIAHLAIQKLGEALAFVADATAKASQAQSNLNAMYGAAAPAITAFAEKQAGAFGRSRTEGREAAASIGLVADKYALAATEIDKVLAVSGQLATIKNIPLADAAGRVQEALAGNADAIRELAILINSDGLKALANMTDAERKQFDALSDIGKAQTVLNAIQQDSNESNGESAKRLDTLAGSTQNLNAKTADLAATIGVTFTQSVIDSNNALADWADWLDKIIQKYNQLGQSALVPLPGETGAEYQARIEAMGGIAAAGATPAKPPPGPGQPGFIGPLLPTARQVEAHQADLLRPQLHDAQRAADREAEANIKAIEKEKAAKEKWYDEEKQRIEARRAHQIEAIEAARDAAIKALEDQRQAQKEADEAAIKDSDRRRDAELAAVDQAHDQVLASIKSRQEELKRARELEDRDTADSRERADRTLSDFRAYQDRTREADHQKELRRIDERHQQAVKAFEDEASAERKKSDQAQRNIDRQAKQEDDRHRRALKNIDDESNAQLAAIQAQIDALDAADKAAQNTSRVADLQKAVSDAQAALQQAQGTGTPEQIAAARGDLTAALRVPGNEVGAANARERLRQLAGAGADAVKKAQEDLQKALKDLQDEQTKEARDAEKDRLRAAQDAIKARVSGEKDAEDDRDRRRKADIDKEKQAESDKLADTLAKLDKRKGAEAQAHDERVQNINDEYKAGTERIAAARLEQDRAIADRRKSEDRDRADRRDAEDAALAQQQQAADKAREDERKAVSEHYDGPNGVTTQLKEAARQHDLEYARMLAAEKAAYDAELKLVNDLYHNADGTGMLDQLGAARASEIASLEASKGAWQDWQKSVSQSIKDALDDLNDFIRRGAGGIPGVGGSINSGGGVGNEPYGPAVPGGGPPSGYNLDEGQVKAFIRQVAPQYGIPAEDALAVWSGEGRSGYTGDHGTSFGPYQLHTPGGLGDQFTRDTGLDPRNPATWQQQIVWTMGYVKRHGWNDQWHGAPGYPGKGISNRKYAIGGWIMEPVVGRGLASGAAYTLGEVGPEYVSPSRSIAGSGSLLGAAPMANYAAMGAQMSMVHTGAGGSYVEGDINVYGAGTEDVLVNLRREQRRQSLLRGGKAVRRW